MAKRVAGAVVEHDGERRRIEARAGVILASGSFEADPELRDTYLPLPLTAVGHAGKHRRHAPTWRARPARRCGT